MYQFSSKTFVNKEYKLNDFLKQIKASKEVKEDAEKTREAEAAKAEADSKE
jgi:hypothetical protein